MYIANYVWNNWNFTDKVVPNIIKCGSKYMYLTFRGIRCVDSLNFLPMALEKFTSTFNLTELKKGYFPHTFNLKKNFNYKGSYPDKKYYDSHRFSNEKKEAFDLWYEDCKYKEFDFKKELFEYCKSDVLLLQEGCLQFRSIIKDISDIDPFVECTTIASLCHLIFRKMNMIPKSIGILPSRGFNAEQKQSKSAILWMKYIMFKNPAIKIKHSLNGGEIALGSYLIDGYCNITNTFYEFHGCYFHGCPKCFSALQYCSQFQKTFYSIYKNHKNRIENIKHIMENEYSGSKLIEMWECDFNYQKNKDEDLKKFMLDYEYVEPLNPRDALFGGRTNAISLYHKASEDEKIKYVDFTSLYPAVQKYDCFPVGHPEIITENFTDINQYFGIVKCTVLPPQNLFLPVLGVKMHSKLLFPLCYSCAKGKLSECYHDEKERVIMGTWVSFELQTAVKYGYKIIKIHEVWHYSNKIQQNKETNKSGLFGKQVDLFLKYKQEASGFPNNVKSEEEKDQYISDYYKAEGILLEKDKIKKNSGLRTVMKLCLNSFWGKFGQEENKTKIKFVKDYKGWLELMAHDKYTIKEVDFTIQDIAVIFYKEKQNQYVTENFTLNVVLAAITTAYGRLKLLDVMIPLDKRVLYHDTDSIIYKVKNGESEPPLGNNLGDLTNEISEEDGGYITEIVCPGPKNYAYKTATGKTKCIVKGFTLNHQSSKSLNFDIIRKMILKNSKEKVDVEQFTITRKKNELRSEIIKKKYDTKYDKRIISEDGSWVTYPYGYKL